MDENLEDKCFWKIVADKRDVEDNLTEHMKYCKYECNGYNKNCEDYIGEQSISRG